MELAPERLLLPPPHTPNSEHLYSGPALGAGRHITPRADDDLDLTREPHRSESGSGTALTALGRLDPSDPRSSSPDPASRRHSLRGAGLRVAGTLPPGQLAMGAAVVGGHGGAVQLISALHGLHLAAWGRGTGPLSPAWPRRPAWRADPAPSRPSPGLTACTLG